MAVMLSAARRQAFLVVALVTAAIPAAAEERPPVRLSIDGLTPGLEVRVLPRPDPDPDPPPKGTSCTADCVLALEKGPYTLIASRGEERNVRDVELTSSQVLRVGHMDGVARTAGTVLGITGIVIATLGALVMVAVAVEPPPPPDSDEAPPGLAGVFAMGLLGAAAGTGLAVGGFSLAAANKAPSMDLRPMYGAHPPASVGSAGLSLSRKF